jgi:hypothetical protein
MNRRPLATSRGCPLAGVTPNSSSPFAKFNVAIYSGMSTRTARRHNANRWRCAHIDTAKKFGEFANLTRECRLQSSAFSGASGRKWPSRDLTRSVSHGDWSRRVARSAEEKKTARTIRPAQRGAPRRLGGVAAKRAVCDGLVSRGEVIASAELSTEYAANTALGVAVGLRGIVMENHAESIRGCGAGVGERRWLLLGRAPQSYDGARKTGSFPRSRHGRLHGGPECD